MEISRSKSRSKESTPVPPVTEQSSSRNSVASAQDGSSIPQPSPLIPSVPQPASVGSSFIVQKRPASEDLRGAEDGGYTTSSESEDDEDSRRLRSSFIFLAYYFGISLFRFLMPVTLDS